MCECIKNHQLHSDLVETLELDSDTVVLLEFVCGTKSENSCHLWDMMDNYAKREGKLQPYTCAVHIPLCTFRQT